MAEPVVVTISLADSAPKLGDFGSLAVFCKCPYALQGRTYTADSEGLAAMVVDGFTTKSPGYRIVSAIAAQENGVPEVLVCPRAAQNAQGHTCTPTVTTEGFKYEFEIEGPTGTTLSISYPVPAAATGATISAALVALITGIGVTATVVSGTFTLAPTAAGGRYWIKNMPWQMTVLDTSADAGIATDLNTALVENPDFYGFVIDSESEAELNAARVWADANGRMFVGQTIDSIVGTSSSTDVGSDFSGASSLYAKVYFVRDLGCYTNASIMAKVFGGEAPDGWEFQSLNGVTAPRITATERGYLDTKLVGYMKSARGEIFSYNTKNPGRYPDLVRGFDWFKDGLEAACLKVFLDMASQGGVSYTQQGIGLLESAIRSQCIVAQGAGLLAPGWTVVPQLVENANPLDKSARLLKNMYVFGTLAGKVERMQIKVIVAP
jgi:hypothetical protein